MELGLFAFAAVVLAVFLLARREDRKREVFLATLARELDGTDERHRVSGRLGGVAVALSFTTRGSGKSSTHWTEIECPLPPGYPLSLHVRRHGWFDRGAIERGTMVDVIVGDPDFDAAYRVEAAPAEVVKQLLDTDARALLLRHDYGVKTVAGRLRLERIGWHFDVAEATAACRVATDMVRSLRTAHAELDAAVERPVVGGAYRGFASDAPLEQARAARAEEVARVEQLVRRRHWWLPAVAVFAVLGLMVLGALAM